MSRAHISSHPSRTSCFCSKGIKQNSKNKKEEQNDAFVCYGLSSERDKDIWVLDSGASDHMCQENGVKRMVQEFREDIN